MADNILSVCAQNIPFLNRDDATRIELACSHLRQAVALNSPELPLIKSGAEGTYTSYSSSLLKAKDDGVCVYNKNNLVIVLYKDSTLDIFETTIKQASGFDRTLISNVMLNQKFQKDSVLAYTRNINKNTCELMLGKNLLVGFISSGWNYEDAIIISESCAMKMAYRNIYSNRLDLDEEVLFSISDEEYLPYPKNGTVIQKGDVLFNIGTLTSDSMASLVPTYDSVFSPISGVFASDIKVRKDNSSHPLMTKYLKKVLLEQRSEELRVKAIFNEYEPYKYDMFSKRYLYIDQRKKMKAKTATIDYWITNTKPVALGSKLSNRHGNKGTVSIILPDDQMPTLMDGTPLDVVLNPLGVISRMNLGQLYELHLTMAIKSILTQCNDLPDIQYLSKCLEIVNDIDNTDGKVYTKLCEEFITNCNPSELVNDIKQHGFQIIQPPFESCTFEQLQGIMKKANCDFMSKVRFKGSTIDCAVGFMYILRLMHEADHKIFGRSLGSYGAHEQAPSGSNAHRLGEMETWNLMAYEAFDTIKEFMSCKADNPEERLRLFQHLYDNKEELYKPINFDTVTLNTFELYLKGAGIEIKF